MINIDEALKAVENNLMSMTAAERVDFLKKMGFVFTSSAETEYENNADERNENVSVGGRSGSSV